MPKYKVHETICINGTTRRSQAIRKIHDIERRYDELEKSFTGKHEAAANKEAEIPEQQHTTTTKTQREELAGEAEQQHTAMRQRAGKKRSTAKNQELSALIENRKIWTEKNASERDINKKIKKEIRDNKRKKRHEKVQNILEELKGKSIANIMTRKKKILITHWRNEAGDIIADTFVTLCKDLYSSRNDERKDEEDHGGRLENICDHADDGKY